ncbi:transmembrane proteins 14C-domain-containing protein [Melampsora americana]|nr:transmembrane proteins 14C-domain-containing protein [Melampsora americana]
MTSQSIDYLGLAYALFVAGGGLIGYLKASSLPSLIAGGGSGALIGLGAYRSQVYGKPDLVFAVSIALSIFMGKRFLNSGKLMPSGLTSIVSIVMSIRYGIRLLKN